MKLGQRDSTGAPPANDHPPRTLWHDKALERLAERHSWLEESRLTRFVDRLMGGKYEDRAAGWLARPVIWLVIGIVWLLRAVPYLLGGLCIALLWQIKGLYSVALLLLIVWVVLSIVKLADRD